VSASQRQHETFTRVLHNIPKICLGYDHFQIFSLAVLISYQVYVSKFKKLHYLSDNPVAMTTENSLKKSGLFVAKSDGSLIQ
jgi:hypothetical protein